MFKSKYIFETRKTRYLRYLKALVTFCLAGLFSYLLLAVMFILLSQKETKDSNSALYNRPPDLIVVFTGDLGRIPLALQKAKEYKQSHMFITGVHSQNTLDMLLKPLDVPENVDSNLVDIDYLAHNTVENVLSTLRYLRENQGIKRVLVISHDYHIARIKLLLNKIKRPSDQYEFFYTGVESDYRSWRNLKILFKEVYKLARVYLFLLFWEA